MSGARPSWCEFLISRNAVPLRGVRRHARDARDARGHGRREFLVPLDLRREAGDLGRDGVEEAPALVSVQILDEDREVIVAVVAVVAGPDGVDNDDASARSAAPEAPKDSAHFASDATAAAEGARLLPRLRAAASSPPSRGGAPPRSLRLSGVERRAPRRPHGARPARAGDARAHGAAAARFDDELLEASSGRE